MMKKALIPRGKLSKKQRRILDLKKRSGWVFSPVTRVMPDKTVYRRERKPNRANPDRE